MTVPAVLPVANDVVPVPDTKAQVLGFLKPLPIYSNLPLITLLSPAVITHDTS